MASKVLLVLAMLVFLVDGHAPGAREMRNPDAEGGGGKGPGSARLSLTAKRT
ncbi:hypothetical protein [Methylobacterium sp. sgz302541]|uniref:hypothetical protein n=1 Tax=unclassified Methylobacterium TaxID=2615210 RepID=UPI003D34AE08